MDEEKKPQVKKSFSLDWLVQGVLTKVGDTFDRLTGRGWNPSSSLATSKLTEKIKFLLDTEAKDFGKDGKFVPHIIKLKIQWDKFSTDSEDDIEKLEHELHSAAIDHINDRLYHTYDPIEIQIKTDYFTEGVQLLGSFGKFADEGEDEAEVNVTLPNLRDQIPPLSSDALVVDIERMDERFRVTFNADGKDFDIELDFAESKRKSVGRTKEQDLTIPDPSVSKIQASLVYNKEKGLLLADTGSTNGTFINDERIKYGKAFEISDGTEVKFGNVKVVFEQLGSLIETQHYQPSAEEVEIMPTQAAVNVNGEDMPTEAFVGNVSDEIPAHEVQASDENPDWAMTNNDLDFSEDEIDSSIAELKSEPAPTEAFNNASLKENSNTILEPMASRVIEGLSDKLDDIDFGVDEDEAPDDEDRPSETEEFGIDKTQDWEV